MSKDEVLTIKDVASIPKTAEKTVRVHRDGVNDCVERRARGRIGKSAPPKP